MFWQPIDRFASKIFGHFPLRTVLVVPFVIQIVGVVMLVSWLSWRHSHQAVTDLAQQLQIEVTQRIHDYLHTHLAKPHLLNQVNASALQLGLVELTQKQRLINHFWHQINHLKLTHYIGIATAKTYIGVRRLKEQLIIVEHLDEQGQLNIWETDQQAQLKQLRSQIAHFNPQIQPWYQAALNNQRWTGVYAHGQHLSLYASQPLYHDTQLQAVLSVNIELLELSRFLAQLSPGHSFIMDDKGLLIASSQLEVLFDSLAASTTVDEFFSVSPFTLKVIESSSPLMRATARYLTEHPLRSGQQIVNFEQQDYFLQVKPFTDQWGLKWYSVVLIPTHEVMSQLHAHKYFILLLCLFALIMTLLIGFHTSRWIVHPLLQLAQAAQNFARQQQLPPLEPQRQDEIGQLNDCFRRMATQLQASFAALEQKNQELHHLDKLKDEFLANTSHELRTPLNGIVGIAEALIAGSSGALSKEICAELNLIALTGQRLTTLINDILDFSQLKKRDIVLHLRPLELRELVELVLRLVHPLVGEKNLTLINAIPPNLPPALADENRIQQILYNLIGNAIKFTESGSLKISARIIKAEQQEKTPGLILSPLEHPLVIADKWLAITVADSGAGIPPQLLDYLFEPFEQGRERLAQTGTGLGLTVTKKLVELHGGVIEVDSKIGLGTRFSFTLPLSRKLTEASKTPTHDEVLLEEHPFTVTHPVFEPVDKSTTTLSVPQLRAESQEGFNYKILIVDDEPVNLYVLVNYLSLYHYQVIQATSGHEALTLLEQGLQADLVLLDVMMPQMTGYEVTQAIRKHWQADELPILLLTAKNQIADLVTGLEVGANDYLIKPISKNELLARIKTHLRLKSLKAETVRLATEGEQRLTQFLQALPIGILVLDIQGQPYWLNKKAQQLLAQDVPEQEIEAIAAHYHWYRADQDSFYPDDQLPGIMALKGETLRVDDLEMRHPEQTIPIEAWGAPIFDDNNQIIYALMAFQDISERRQAEQQSLQANQELYALNQKLEEYSHTLEQKVAERTHELQTSEASLAEAQYMGRLGHWIWERHRQTITRSEQDCRNLGLPPEHCAPTFEAFLACVHPEDRAAISVIINFSCQARQEHSYDSTEFEFRVCWPNGQIRTLLSRIVLEFDAAGDVERIKGLSQDITERHQMECALQDNVHFLETMLQAIPSPVFFKDHQGRYQGCNKAFETFTGYSKEALLGRTVFDVWPSEYAQSYHEHDLLLLRTPGIHAYEAQVRAGDGREHFVIFTKASYTNAQGAVAGLVGVFTDITERKQTEAKLQQAKQTAEQTLQQLQATQQRLIEAAKMADLGQLVAGVAHEINTPIGIGLTAASRLETLTQELNQLFEQGQLKRADFAKYLQSITQGSELISKNLKRAAELIQSFKQVAVDQSGEQRRTFVLKDYLEEILISLRPRLKATQHQITIEADPKLSINSYPGAFSQIITNLVINSLIHGFREQNNGHITIRVTQLSALPEFSEGVLIRYCDDGQGMTAETLSHIFEPFFTTNRQGGGSGLGLHIVYNLVTHQLKGNIRCESEWGHGSCFIMEIPID